MTSIGGDWIQQTDESSGCPYYTNTVTGETTWDYPPELAGGAAASTEGNWIETYDESSGAYYYLHDVTGESTWEKPENYVPAAGTGVVAEAAGVDPDSDPTNWTTGEDNGAVYYINSVTGLTQWDMPACMNAEAPAAPAESEKPEPVVNKRASFMPPPTIAAAIPKPPVDTGASPSSTVSQKRASFLPPPSLGSAIGGPKPPVAMPGGGASVKDRQAALSVVSEETTTRSSLAADEIGSRPQSVKDLKAQMAGLHINTPDQTAPPPPPPGPPEESVAAESASSGDKTGATDDVEGSASQGGGEGETKTAGGSLPAKRMTKMQSFAALRAMESVNEDEESTFTESGECGISYVVLVGFETIEYRR